MSDQHAVIVEDLVKVYPGGTRAISGINFTVAQGEFFGFLGPNGAGKSTTLKVLSTLLKKTSGNVQVAGYDVDHKPDDVRKSIGFAMQEVGIDDLATGWDFLILQGRLYGLSGSDAKRRAGELLELVGLTDVAKHKVGTYSGGMRRRVDLVAALMHSPPIVFLDEPTTGLDPQSRLAIWAYLKELNSQGTTVFLTTQMMEEADQLCRRVAIVDRGEIVAEGSPAVLKSEMGGDVIHVLIGATSDEGTEPPMERAEALVRERNYVEDVAIDGTVLVVRAQGAAAVVPDLLRLLNDNQIPVSSVSVANPTLDDVFLKYTGHTIRSEGAGGDGSAQAMRPWLGLNRN